MPSVCALPGLIWPSAGAAEILHGMELPGLAALLGSASVHHASAIPLESWLAGQFGIAGEPPSAALRLAGETSFLTELPGLDSAALDSPSSWLCADPVSLRFSREHLLLSDAATLSIRADEAQAVIAGLNATFGDIGHFVAATPTRWYLSTRAAIDVHFHPLAQVVGRPVAHFQPEGDNQHFWAQVSNELQVFCHNHPINTAREAAGQPPLNALWLWGAGRLPATPPRPPAGSLASNLQETTPLLAGLAKLSGSPVQPLADPTAAEWMLVNDLTEPAMQRDLTAWLDALRRIDANVLQPLAHALKRSHIEHLEIVAPCDQTLLTLDVHAIPRWQFWRRDASHADVVKLLASSEVAA